MEKGFSKKMKTVNAGAVFGLRISKDLHEDFKHLSDDSKRKIINKCKRVLEKEVKRAVDVSES